MFIPASYCSDLVDIRRYMGTLCRRIRSLTQRSSGKKETIRSPVRELSENKVRRTIRRSLHNRSTTGWRAVAHESIHSRPPWSKARWMFSSSRRTPGEYLEKFSSKAILNAKLPVPESRLYFKARGALSRSNRSNITRFSSKPFCVIARKKRLSSGLDANAPLRQEEICIENMAPERSGLPPTPKCLDHWPGILLID